MFKKLWICLIITTIVMGFGGCAIIRGASKIATSTVTTTVKTTGKIVDAVVPD